MTSAAVSGPTEKGRAAAALAAQITGSTGDKFAHEWREMSVTERDFWLQASRLPRSHAYCADWGRIPGTVRCTLKNNLYRAARRAEFLLGIGGQS